jgi:hypothetical protein
MIIYNVTVNINHAVHDQWLKWMKDKHIPDVLATGLFVDHKIYRLIGDEQSGGVTYAVQYSCLTMEDYIAYRDRFAAGLQQDALQLFGDQFTAFRTLLETV